MAHHLAAADAAATIRAVLRIADPVERITGGYETDVFRSGDGRLALKLKHATGALAAMVAWARRLEHVADLFRAYLGPAHSLQSDFLIVPGPEGESHVLSVQPFLEGAHALDTLDVAGLDLQTRTVVARQLEEVVARALACFRDTGYLPDLYGLSANDGAQARRWDLRWLPRVGWRIVAGRPLLTTHNLLFTADGRIVLVDYDPICFRWPFCRLVYTARALLLRRDRRQLAALASGPGH